MPSLYARYHPSASVTAPASVELRVDDETYLARIDDGQLTIERGAAPGPELIVSLDHDTLIRLLGGGGSGRDAPGSGVTIVAGSEDAFESFLRLFT